MKIVFTLVEKSVKDKVIQGVLTRELIVEDIASFQVDEGTQKIYIKHNSEEDEVIQMYTLNPEGDFTQWTFLDIKCFQVPLNVKL